jgi:hypothetical protein
MGSNGNNTSALVRSMQHKSKKMRILFIIFCLLSLKCYPQQKDLSGYYEKVKKGLCERPTDRCSIQITNYFEACEIIGNYYYKAKKFAKARTYYSKVTDLNMDGHGFLELSALRPSAKNTYRRILEKMGMMYLNGIGIKQDINKAISYLNIVPNPFSRTERNKFSQLLFNNLSETAVYKNFDLKNDSLIIVAINPFFVYDTTTSKLLDKYLEPFDKLLVQDSSLICTISISLGMFHRDEISAWTLNDLINNLKTPYVSKKADNYFKEVDFESYNEIIIQKISFPKLTIKITH